MFTLRFWLRLVSLLLLLSGLAPSLRAQTATGSVSGNVSDSSGAAVPGATVTITNKSTSVVRTTTSNSVGLYTVPGLEAGQYAIRSQHAGFKTVTVDGEVQAGNNLTANIVFSVGEISEQVTVEAATPTMDYESHTVEGVIEQESIQNIPTNGRSFVELASLQPGVTLSTSFQGIMNSPLKISILGGTGQYPLVTMDGLQINDYLDGYATAAVNFSTEVIQEFQLSSANFDLSTPANIQGSVNMVTRSGSNTFHGGAYMFYRDHNMAAYPGLNFNPFNPDPYFVRKNPGFLLGGRIIKDKLFYFGSYEYTGQASAIAVDPSINSTKGNAGIFTSPFHYNYTTVRLDYAPNRLKTNWFLRWTQDRNGGLSPQGSVAYPSGLIALYNWSEQYALGATTAFTSNLVAEMRFGFRDWHNRTSPPPASTCAASTVTSTPCLGGPVASAIVDPAYQGVTNNLAINGLPQMSMAGDSTFVGGVSGQAVNDSIRRDFEPQVNMTWLKGNHRIRFGYDLDVFRVHWALGDCSVGCLTVESFETMKSTLGATTYQNFFPAGFAPPSIIDSNQALLQLPVEYPSGGFTGGQLVGPLAISAEYESEKQAYVFLNHWYFEDYWKLKKNLTLNYGLGYIFDARLFPSDMPMPALEGPIFGLDPNTKAPPTPTSKLEFQPAFGLTWSPGASGKTVLRLGAGLYWDTASFSEKGHSLANIGPIGNGPLAAPSTIFTNLFGDPVPGGPTPIDPTLIYVPAGTSGASATDCQLTSAGSKYCVLAVGAPIPSLTFSTLTLGQYEQIFNQEYAEINALFTNPNPIKKGPYPYSNVDLIKANTLSFGAKMPMPRSYQTSVGIQRQVTNNLAVTADFVYKMINQATASVDLNHYNEYSLTTPGVQTPVIPKCTNENDGGSIFTLGAQCSTGAMTTQTAGLQARYEGLLVSAVKRMSNHYQFNLSYAYQTLYTETVINLNNWKQGWGPSIPHQNLNVAGIANLPWGFGFSLNSSIISRAPVKITCGVDFSGTTGTPSPCPGLPYSGWPSNKAIINAATNFNGAFVGQTAPSGQKVLAVAVPPAGFTLGRAQFSQDVRLTKTFTLEKRYSLALYGEVFNVFNISNKTGYGVALSNSSANTFGIPTARAGQVFLSSGPRAEQIGARITF